MSAEQRRGASRPRGAANVVLNGCDITGNIVSQGGGGIAMQGASSGSLTLNGTAVTGNRTSAMGGGGIASFGSGTVTINPNSAITENAALGRPRAAAASWSAGGTRLNIVGAVIRDNRIIFRSTGSSPPPGVIVATDPGLGGGIENAGAGAVSISGSILEGNSAASSGGGYGDTGLASLTIRDSFLLDNAAGESGGGLAAGGPLITLTNVTVAGNTQLRPTVVGDLLTGMRPTSAGGGGLYLFGAGTAHLIDSTLAGNTAITLGGGIDDNALAELIVTGSTVADNHALSVSGGGLYMRPARPTRRSSTASSETIQPLTAAVSIRPAAPWRSPGRGSRTTPQTPAGRL